MNARKKSKFYKKMLEMKQNELLKSQAKHSYYCQIPCNNRDREYAILESIVKLIMVSTYGTPSGAKFDKRMLLATEDIELYISEEYIDNSIKIKVK